MTDPFHSSKYRIARAKEHIGEFQRLVVEFHKTDPYARVAEVDPNTSEQVHKIKLVKPMPVALQGLADEAVHHLRSALDNATHTVAALANKNTRFDKFPFAPSETKFKHSLNGWAKDLPKEIIDLLGTFKPYKRGNDLLWALNELSNTNKHAIICSVPIASGGIQFDQAEFIGHGPLIPIPVWDRTKNEMEVFRVLPGTYYKVKFHYAAFVAFSDVEVVDGQPAIAVLNELARIVESIVMAIEAESKRIGLF